MSTKYPEAMRALLGQIEQFRRQELSLEDLKSALWETARVVSSHEERPLRTALQQAEGQLDMLQHTKDEGAVDAEVLKAIDLLEARIRAAVSAPR